MILEIVEPRDLNDDKLARFRTQETAGFGAIGISGERAGIDAVINHFHPIRRQSFVGNQSLANRFANAHAPVATRKQQPVDDHSFPARKVGLMPAVLGEQDRLSRPAQPGRHGIKERPVLVGMHDVDLFVLQQLGQSQCTVQIESRSPAETMDRKSVADQIVGQRSAVVETGEYESDGIPQSMRDSSGQDLCPADAQ